MKAFWALYWKELKSNKIILLFLIIAAYGMLNTTLRFPLWICLRSDAGHIGTELLLLKLSSVSLFLLPLALFYLLTAERRKNLNYLIFSLPLRRDLCILSQFMVMVSFILFIPIGIIILEGIMDITGKILLLNYT